MSAQPIPSTQPAPSGLAVRNTPATRPGHLRVLPIPDNEPPPVPAGQTRSATDPRFIQGTLAMDFRGVDDDDQLFGPRSTSRHDLPDPEAWARRLITAVLEAMDGLRPGNQLTRWVHPDLRERIERRGILARQRKQRPGGPLVIRTIRVCEPVDGVAEVAAVIGYRARVRALALRMSGIDGRWLITALELG